MRIANFISLATIPKLFFVFGLMICFSAKPIVKSFFQNIVEKQEFVELEGEEDTEEKEVDDEVEEYLSSKQNLNFSKDAYFDKMNNEYTVHAYLNYISDPLSPPPDFS